MHAFLSMVAAGLATNSVEPRNKGQVGTSTDVHYSEVVLYWGDLYFTFYDILGRILLQCGYKVVCVRIRKIRTTGIRVDR